VIRAIVVSLGVIGAVVIGAMIGCCFLCAKCEFEIPPTVPSVSQQPVKSADSLREPLRIPGSWRSGS
jgi:hypothetical protein